MKIYNIQNSDQTSFGIKYMNKKAWSPDVLKAFENSELLKSIDKNYPNAKVRYTKYSGEGNIANAEIIHTLIMDIKLAKDKIYRWNLSSHTEDVPEKILIDEIKTLTLKGIEQDAKPLLISLETISKKPKRNPVKAFFSKIFS